MSSCGPTRAAGAWAPHYSGGLIAATEAQGLWTLQANIFPENEAALGLHQKLGFRVVGTRERIGRHRGRWRDVLLLERRSPSVA